MKIFVGLGNPGKEYEETRHNTGFLFLEEMKNQITNYRLQISNKSQIPIFEFQKKFKAEICQLGDFLLVKPQTFMNSSGEAVKKILQFNNITIQQYNNLSVVHDDLDIPLGEYKIQFGRSSAGHKGVESIIKALGTKDFWRVRIGIQRDIKKLPARPAGGGNYDIEGKEFVLQRFDKEEKIILNEVIEEIIKNLINA